MKKKVWLLLAVITAVVVLILLLCRDKIFGSKSTTEPGVSAGTSTNLTRYGQDDLPLVLYSGGDRVKILQQYLNKIYSLSLVVDGKLGPKTYSAMQSFMGLNEITEDVYINYVLASQKYGA